MLIHTVKGNLHYWLTKNEKLQVKWNFRDSESNAQYVDKKIPRIVAESQKMGKKIVLEDFQLSFEIY